MDKSGFTAEDYASEPVDPWPENETAYALLKYMRTQWRMGPGGPAGLDYNVMHNKMTRMHLTSDEYDQLEADLQVMEMAAINCIYKKI